MCTNLGRPVDDDVIKDLIESDRNVIEREIGAKLNIKQSTIHDHNWFLFGQPNI